jgi:hypothetical protein
MSISGVFELPTITSTERERLLACAEIMLQAEKQMLSSDGQHILHYTLKNNPKHTKKIHYPRGDRIDKKTGAQYFYHCHRENYAEEEHGHFHCFMRYPNIPKHIKPSALPDWDKHIDNPMTHIIAISISRYGKPIRLFTVNRWVSSEIWYDAEHTPQLLSQFKMTLTDDPYWYVLDQWIEALIQVFSPQITWLQHARDAYVKQKQTTEKSEHAVYHNRAISELSEIPINIEKQVQWLLD